MLLSFLVVRDYGMASFLYEDLSDWRTVYLKVMEGLAVVAALQCVRIYINGETWTYSKFADATKMKGKTISSRRGMLLLYSPAGIVALLVLAGSLKVGLSTGEYPNTRFLLVAGAFAVHFTKRVLEVLFVHRYSGVMELRTSVLILVFYLLATLNVLLAQHVAVGMPPPSMDTTGTGLFLCVLGMAGNFYHHLLLRNLRKDGSKNYVTPEGGLFSVFVAPHYIFEMIEFIGIAFLSQTSFSVVSALSIVLTLGARSYATKHWYRKKIDGLPSNRCALIPGLF